MGGSRGLLVMALLVLTAVGLAVLVLDQDLGPGGGLEGDTGVSRAGDGLSPPQEGDGSAPMVVPEGVERKPVPLQEQERRLQSGLRTSPAVDLRKVSGRLLRTADRSPIVGEHLGWGDRSVVTNADDGSFELDVPQSITTLHLRLGGRQVFVPLPSAEGDLNKLELLADTGWILTGVVRDGFSEQVPFPAITVGKNKLQGDAAGRFRILDVPASASKLSFSAPLHTSREFQPTLTGEQRVLDLGDIRLTAAGAVQGFVWAPGGEALEAGVQVRIALEVEADGFELNSRIPPATPDEDGRYRLDGVPAGEYVLVVVTSWSRAYSQLRAIRELGDLSAWEQMEGVTALYEPPAQWLPHVLVRAGEVTKLDVQLMPGAAVTGRITDGSGNPLERAVVEVVHSWRQTLPDLKHASMAKSEGFTVSLGVDGSKDLVLTDLVAWTTTDEQGNYRLGALPQGDVVIRAVHGEHPGWMARERTVNLVSGSTSRNIELQLGGGRIVRGRVFDATERPAQGAAVVLVDGEGAALIADENRVETTADGRFEFAGLSPGNLRLAVSLKGHRTLVTAVDPTVAEQRIDLGLGAAVKGVVRDASTGRPLQSFQVRLENDVMFMTRTRQDAKGEFELVGLEPGEYLLLVTAAGYQPGVLGSVLASSPAVPVDVALQPLP